MHTHMAPKYKLGDFPNEDFFISLGEWTSWHISKKKKKKKFQFKFQFPQLLFYILFDGFFFLLLLWFLANERLDERKRRFFGDGVFCAVSMKWTKYARWNVETKKKNKKIFTYWAKYRARRFKYYNKNSKPFCNLSNLQLNNNQPTLHCQLANH